MTHRVTDLSTDQRLALEALLGRSLHEDESLVVRPCRVLKPAPQGAEREAAAQNYLSHLDSLSERASGVSANDLEAAIEKACHHARHDGE